MAALEQLGKFVADYRPDDRARAAVRLHIADTVGAWIAASGTTEGRALLAFRQPGAPLPDQVAINCALVRLSEVDDIHLAGMITPGAIVIPAALTIAASLPAVSADDLVAAVVAGYEAMIRFGVAIDGPSVLYRGIWPSYFAAPLGAAAVAARLMRLDDGETAHALATALIMTTPGTGHHAAKSTARWLAVGLAAGRGLQAAQAARGGFTSDLKLADGDFLKNIYGITPNVSVLGGGVGEVALHQVSFKPWCAARQTMAATQALKEILAGGISAGAIEQIGVGVLPPHQRMIDHGVTAGDRFSHLTSVQYQMAVAALTPDAAYDIGGPSDESAPALARFMARIEVRADETLLLENYPRAWPAKVTVTASGERRESFVTQVPGDPGLPYSEEQLRHKFCRVVSPVMDEDRADTTFSAGLSALDRPGEAIRMIEKIVA